MNLKIILLAVIVTFALGYVYRRRLKLTLVDFFLASNALFFGIYPIIDILNNNYQARIDVFVLSILYIIITFLLLVFFMKTLFSKKLRRTLKFNGFLKKASAIPQNIINYSFIISFGIVLYFFLRYSLIFRVLNEDLLIVNTYKQIIGSIAFPLFTLVSVSAVAKILVSAKINYTYLLNLLFLSLISLYWLFYGRRELVFHLLILGLTWLVYSKGRLKFKNFIYGFFGLALVIMGSNIYQNMRWQIMSYSINHELTFSKGFIEMAFDFESSARNLESRPSGLPMMSTVIDEVSSNKNFSNGKIFISALNNSIPSSFTTSKVFVNDDEIVARQLQIPYTDFATSLYSSFYMDFGMFSFLLLPFFLFLYYLFVTMTLIYLNKTIFLSVLVYIVALMSTLNMETSVSGITLSFRLILLITLSYFLLNKFFRYFFNIRL